MAHKREDNFSTCSDHTETTRAMSARAGQGQSAGLVAGGAPGAKVDEDDVIGGDGRKV